MNSPTKTHGGKGAMAPDIVKLFPPHLAYVEPYAGGLSVLFAKDPSNCSEVVNDLDGDVACFWRCLRDEETFARLRRKLTFTPFSELDYLSAQAMVDVPPSDDVVRAWGFFVRCRQSMAGRQKGFSPISRTRTRRGMNEQASGWLSAIEGLPEVHERLKRVVILNRPAVEVIRTQAGSKVLQYLDPPYHPDTRTAKEIYRHEMTAGDHEAMLTTVLGCEGMFAISGYRCDLYDRMLSGWKRHEFDMPNHAAGGDTKRRMVECLYCNF